jgi:hypothetical protein
MTDFANEMSGLSKQARRLRHSKNEYRVYLTLIFLAALPFCTVIWAYRLIRHMTLPTLGPIQSAISEGAHHHATNFSNVGSRFPGPNGMGSQIRSSAWGSGIKAGDVPLL